MSAATPPAPPAEEAEPNQPREEHFWDRELFSAHCNLFHMAPAAAEEEPETAGWKRRGYGALRLLQHPVVGDARLVLNHAVTGRLVLNARVCAAAALHTGADMGARAFAVAVLDHAASLDGDERVVGVRFAAAEDAAAFEEAYNSAREAEAERVQKPLKRISSRASRLALVQTEHTRKLLTAAHPQFRWEVVTSKTHGDKVLDRPLAELGSGNPGLFTKELEADLMRGTTCLAVHSLKDVPTTLPPGLTLGAILERESPEDALLLHPKHAGLDGLGALPEGAVVGTSSLRRRALIARAHPHLTVRSIRGNIHTRIAKLEEHDDYDAIVLASVGLLRCELSHKMHSRLSPDWFPYGVSQGTLAVECREDDEETLALLAAIEHVPSKRICEAERGVLRALEGGCQVPLGVRTTLSGEGDEQQLTLYCAVLSVDGETMVADEVSGPVDQAQALGEELAAKLREQGAAELVAEGRRPITYGSAELPAPASERLDAASASSGSSASEGSGSAGTEEEAGTEEGAGTEEAAGAEA